MVHNYQENCILECSRPTDTRSDFLLIFLQRMSGYGVDLYGDGDVVDIAHYGLDPGFCPPPRARAKRGEKRAVWGFGGRFSGYLAPVRQGGEKSRSSP